MKKLLGIGLLFISLSIVMTGCASLKSLYAETPDDQGEITIIMDDFEFQPSTVKFEAGETVRIKLINRGTKAHEFMVGRNPTVHDGQTEVFTTDFFSGIEVKASGPGMAMRMGEMGGMDMGGEGDMDMDMEEGDMDMDEGDMDMEEGDHEDGGHEEGDDHEDEGMDMEEGDMDMEEGDHEDGGHEEGDDHEDEGMDMEEGDMDMEEGDHEDDGHEEGDDHEDEGMDMEGEDHEEEDGHGHEDEATPAAEEGDHTDEEEGEHAHEEEEAAMSGEFAAVQEPLMHPHPGYMVLLQPITVQPNEEPTIIEFTIPEDKAGVWTIGCFQESGLHFDDGMRGTLIVTPAD